MNKLLDDRDLEMTLWHIVVAGEEPKDSIRAASLSLEDSNKVKALKQLILSQQKAWAEYIVTENAHEEEVAELKTWYGDMFQQLINQIGFEEANARREAIQLNTQRNRNNREVE